MVVNGGWVVWWWVGRAAEPRPLELLLAERLPVRVGHPMLQGGGHRARPPLGQHGLQSYKFDKEVWKLKGTRKHVSCVSTRHALHVTRCGDFSCLEFVQLEARRKGTERSLAGVARADGFEQPRIQLGGRGAELVERGAQRLAEVVTAEQLVATHL